MNAETCYRCDHYRWEHSEPWDVYMPCTGGGWCPCPKYKRLNWFQKFWTWIKKEIT